MFKAVTRRREDGTTVTYASHIPIKWPLIIGGFSIFVGIAPAKTHDWGPAIFFFIVGGLCIAYAIAAIVKDLGVKKWP